MFPIVRITDSFYLPTYLLIISLTYCISLLWVIRRAEKRQLSRNIALDICLCIMLGGFLGARLLHVAFEAPEYYQTNPIAIFKFWQGGFVFYGGVFGALIASIWLLRRRKQSFTTWADLFAPVVAFTYAIGRLSCLAAGCCYGRPTSLPWGISFPAGVEAPAGIALHPTQIYASLWEFILLAFILFFERKKLKPGMIFWGWALFHALGRLMMEYFRDDNRGPGLFGLSLSSWISLHIAILAAYMIFEIKNTKVEVE